MAPINWSVKNGSIAADTHVEDRATIARAIDTNTLHKVPSVTNPKNTNMLAMKENSEPDLIILYLPNFTSASQPMRGAKSLEANMEIVVKR